MLKDMMLKISRLFPNREFFFLWLFHLLSLLGSELTRFALPIWLFQQEENLISFSIFMCCGLLPRILFSPLAGGLIDHINKQKVFITSGISLITISIVLVLIVSKMISGFFLLICSLIFLMGIFSNLIHIATLATIPQLVPKDELLKGNSLMVSAESSAILISPLLAGFLIFKFDFALVTIVDIFLFSISLIFIFLIKNIKKNITTTVGLITLLKNVRASLISGIQFIKSDRRLILLLITTASVNFIFSMSFVAFTPMILIASSNNTGLLGTISSIGSGGQLLGSLFAGYFIKSNFRTSLMMKCIIILGLCGPFVIGLKFSPFYWAIGYAMTLAGLSIINSLNHSFWQQSSPTELQGTIFGVRRMISSSIAPIGTLMAGPFMTFLFMSIKPGFLENEYQMIFLLSGILIVLIGVIGFSLKTLRQTTPSIYIKNE